MDAWLIVGNVLAVLLAAHGWADHVLSRRQAVQAVQAAVFDAETGLLLPGVLLGRLEAEVNRARRFGHEVHLSGARWHEADEAQAAAALAADAEFPEVGFRIGDGSLYLLRPVDAGAVAAPVAWPGPESIGTAEASFPGDGESGAALVEALAQRIELASGEAPSP